MRHLPPATERKELWTIQKVLDWSTDYLAQKGVAEPKLSVEWLLADLLGYSRMDLYLHFDKPLQKEELAAFRERLKRRAAYEPTQYIIGSWEFWSLNLKVDPRVLIPRPETETLIEQTLDWVKQGQLPQNAEILELGTGSGAIACALASELPNAHIHAVDISQEALDVAQENARHCHLSDNIQFHHGNLFQPIPKHQTFDLIISNPPYIPQHDLPLLQKEIQLYEPQLALDGGHDGLDIIRTILKEAPQHLKKHGIILLEIGSDQGDLALQTARQHQTFAQTTILKDYTNKDRMLACFLTPKTSQQQLDIEKMAIPA